MQSPLKFIAQQKIIAVVAVATVGIVNYLYGIKYLYIYGNWRNPKIHHANVSARCIPTALADFESLKTLAINDQRVLDFIYCNHMKPPSRLPYPESNITEDTSQFKGLLSRIFKNKTGGFFIECGAHDGYFLSNTWMLERNHKWSGLLIEVNQELGRKLLTRNRKAWFSDVCLSPYNNVTEAEFLVTAVRENQDGERGQGKVVMGDDILYKKYDPSRKIYRFKPYGAVQCFPLTSVLAAINVNHVDYFSLDVQGIESKILKNLPFDNTLTIDMLQAEYELDPEGKEWMRSFMQSKGYKVIYDGLDNFIFERIKN